MCNATATVETVHCFEKAGLGKAPFRYAGMVAQDMAYGERVLGNVGGILVTTKPGGTCDYCGTYIVNMFRVQSADGNEFVVGCDCIEKCGDKGLIRMVKRDVATMTKQRKAARETTRIQAARENLANATTLRSQPHPTPCLAANGKTAWDYASWLLSNAGTSGKLRAAGMIEKAIETVPA